MKGIFIIILLSVYSVSLLSQIEKLPDNKRSSAYSQLFKERLVDTSDKKKIIEKVTMALSDPLGRIRSTFAYRLMRVPKSQFSSRALNQVLKALVNDAHVHFYTILLAGHLEIPETRKICLKLINSDKDGKFIYDISYRSIEFAAHLALARLGYQENIDFVLKYIKDGNHKISTVFYELVEYLGYIRQKQALDIVIDKLFSEEIYEYMAFEKPLQKRQGTYAVRTIPVLVALVEEFPIPRSQIYTYNDVKEARKWLTSRNREYEIKPNAWFIPKQR